MLSITILYPLPDLKDARDWLNLMRDKWLAVGDIIVLTKEAFGEHGGNGRTWMVSPCYWSTGHNYPIET
ncbi:hypothetical protein POPTR_004G011701v4 [Populus trichocarpa]|uniref:Uncharacterized protein n=1 Tax=Populus trichocarpa TaxID=3694 RepID=A0ACC0T2X4_POPTR|nr:hypothetical protein POPTR_004G011701v4 [Populus trichocarpa]